MDENGWEHRKTYIQDRSGNIYEATLNIANGRDRRILYDINNVRQIDKERVARGAVPSTNNGRGSLTKSNSSGNKISDSDGIVKEKFSVNDTEPDYRFSVDDIDNLEIDQQEAVEELLNRIRYALNVPRVAAREHLKGTVEQLSAEFLATGRFTQETVDQLFEDAWNQGVIEDREFYDNYKHIKDFLRASTVTISETDSHDIADYRDFKRRAWGTLKIVNEGGQSVLRNS